MMRVNIAKDCGNSPKNLFLQKMTIAFAKRDINLLLGSITDDIRWNIIADKLVQGKTEFEQTLRQSSTSVDELTISHSVTHGKAGAVNSSRVLSNGKTVSFCDVYEFSGAKGTSIKEITSYIIETR